MNELKMNGTANELRLVNEVNSMLEAYCIYNAYNSSYRCIVVIFKWRE